MCSCSLFSLNNIINYMGVGTIMEMDTINATIERGKINVTIIIPAASKNRAEINKTFLATFPEITKTSSEPSSKHLVGQIIKRRTNNILVFIINAMTLTVRITNFDAKITVHSITKLNIHAMRATF